MGAYAASARYIPLVYPSDLDCNVGRFTSTYLINPHQHRWWRYRIELNTDIVVEIAGKTFALGHCLVLFWFMMF
jgi:hypothetical protein